MRLAEGFGERQPLPRWGKALLGAAAVALAVAVLLPGEDRKQLVLEDARPKFNLLYDQQRLEREATDGGAGVVLSGERRGVSVEVSFTPVELDAYEGDVSSGVLPLLAERLIAQRAEEPGFSVTDEGRARVNDAPGYQVGYVADRRVSGRDVYVVEGPQARRGYLISLRVAGRPSRARDLVRQARKAFRSFRFGTERA